VAYDRRQREVNRTAPDGTFVFVTYDPAGNKATETDALGRVTRFVYDARNRLVATLLPDGTTTRQRVDGGGRVVATIDQAGATTTTASDTLGRTVRETRPDPDGSGPRAAPATAIGYDSRGNVLFVTAFFAGQAGVTAGDPAWSSHFEYDALGRKTKETQADPDGTGPLGRPVTSFAYDADGIAELRRSGARRIALAPWFIAPGRITDRVADLAAELNVAMAEPLGAHPLVAATVLDRFDHAVARGLAA
jgi:YD repeat-containing protein